MKSSSWALQIIQPLKNWSVTVLRVDGFETLPMSARELDSMIESVAVERRLKDDRTTTVAKLCVASEPLILKRYNPRNQWHKIKRALRKSRARRCWQMSYAFQRAGLNVAAPIMMLEHRFGPIRMNAYFANAFLEGQELMSSLPQMTEPEKNRVRAALLSAFEKMRLAKISHGDMKATNLLWVGGELYFIDLDAAEQHSSAIAWQTKHNRDRRRFLKNWQNNPELLALFEGF